ncbi:hypothetical protein CRE_08813 [Caenorhabditis remanei]|uniref:RING-type domain-containing protein n=1 Tax=Caenorhabditis remanei TaxID=31234 RepID=E3LHN7_CAERE|nr:hypothetical protein CRE_08813 [Caenorhabditis remanei]
MPRRSNRVAEVSTAETASTRVTRSATRVPRLANEKNAELEKIIKEVDQTKRQLAAEKKKNETLAEVQSREVADVNSRIADARMRRDREVAQNRADLDRMTADHDNDAKALKQINVRVKALTDEADRNAVLKAEKKAIADLRKKNVGISKQLISREETKNGAPLPWRTCEICLQVYTQTGSRTPRILTCGHTLCLSCCRQVSEYAGQYLRCPFDRAITQVNGTQGENLSKNNLVLNM